MTSVAISKVMGAHLGIASSVTSFLGEGGLLGKKESVDQSPEPIRSPEPPPPAPAPAPAPAEDTRFMGIMKGNFTDMLRVKPKTPEET